MATTVTPFDADNAAVTKLYQWDVGITLYITNSKITEAYNVHFANKTCTEAYSCSSAYSDGVLSVTIPDILLQQACPIFGYIYAEDDDYGRTVFTFKIRVIARPQPTDYVYEESADYILVSDLVDRIETLESGSISSDGSSISVTATDNGYILTIDGVDYEITNGTDGTSAYDAAAAGGYTGTEDEFNSALAAILAMANAEEVSY